MPKRKEELQVMLPVDGRQLEKHERRVVEIEEEKLFADCNYGTTWPGSRRWKEQKNKEIADCQTWHNVGKR
ncbi:hypothetical protein AVEN_223433-1, partial [Araneus ventricosus]